MSEKKKQDAEPTDVECPTCFAWVGWSCSGRGYSCHADGCHRSRIKAARCAASVQP